MDSHSHPHPHRQIPRPGTAALMVATHLILLSLTQFAAAAAKPVAAAQGPCPVRLRNIQFSGTFLLKNAHNKEASPLQFVIGEPENARPRSRKSVSVAQIWSGNQCQATCSSIATEPGEISIPISLDMQCRGAELGPLSVHVALLWGHGKTGSTVLRFGNWVDGYEQATVKVEKDYFAASMPQDPPHPVRHDAALALNSKR